MKMKNLIRKKKPEAGLTRVATEQQSRFNPLRNLSPDYLVACHDEFDKGGLKSAARLWEIIEDSDDILKVVAAKRKKAVARHGFEIIQDDDSAEAKKHAEALQFFYNQLSATRVDDRNVRGGLNLLIRQMMDSVGKRYAVHEIVWKPIAGKLTAEFWHVPLWYFENRTGRLRYLSKPYDRDGVELMPGEWMITSGDGVMRAAAIAYMFKHLPLQDWLIWSERFAKLIPKGKSTGNVGSSEWKSMEQAVAALEECVGVVINSGAEIDLMDPQSKGNLPYPPLVDRMDRALAALWRGADLGTMSSADGTGASLQDGETDLLEDDDADNITDVLNEQVDKFVIKYMFGADAPKAWVKIKSGIRDDVEGDLKIDETLHNLGYESPLADLQTRYGRPGLQPISAESLANENNTPDKAEFEPLLKASRKTIAMAMQEDLMPIAERLEDILDNTPDDQLLDSLEKFRTEELPVLAETLLADPAAAKAFEDSAAAALLSALVDKR